MIFLYNTFSEMKKDYRDISPLIIPDFHKGRINIASYFSQKAPLEVEIGFGNGEYLIKEARYRPDVNFLGTEIFWRPVKSTLRKIHLAGLSNIRLVLLDARHVFMYCLRPRSVSRVYTLFPFPWPKKRHIHKRLFKKEFLRLLNNRLQPNGKFFLVTDHHEFFQWVIEQAKDTGFLQKTTTTKPRFGTIFERVWLSQGQKEFYELHLKKVRHIQICSKEIGHLKTYRLATFSPPKEELKGTTGKTLTVRFGECLFDPQLNKGMLYTIVHEDGTLLQHFWMEIVKENRQWRLRVAKGCHIIPTKGVQKALEMAYKELSRQKRQNRKNKKDYKEK